MDEKSVGHNMGTPHHTTCYRPRDAGEREMLHGRGHGELQIHEGILSVNAAKRSIGFEKATQIQSTRATTALILLYCCCATSRYVLCSARFSRLILHCPCKRSSQRVAIVSKPAPLQQQSNGGSIRIQQCVHNYERNSPIYHENATRYATSFATSLWRGARPLHWRNSNTSLKP